MRARLSITKRWSIVFEVLGERPSKRPAQGTPGEKPYWLRRLQVHLLPTLEFNAAWSSSGNRSQHVGIAFLIFRVEVWHEVLNGLRF